jgi:hypothetical protein
LRRIGRSWPDTGAQASSKVAKTDWRVMRIG